MDLNWRIVNDLKKSTVFDDNISEETLIINTKWTKKKFSKKMWKN